MGKTEKTTTDLLNEANDTIDELRKTIDALAEADSQDRRCKYEPCPEGEHAEKTRGKILDYGAGLAQGLTTVGVIWLLYQQRVIWAASRLD